MRKILLVLLVLSSVLLLNGCGTQEDELIDGKTKFQPLDLEYTGPKLDSKWFDVENIYVEGFDDDGNMEYQGTGLAFEVSLNYAVDGDTAYFNLPESFYSIYPRNKSFRFLNMDTEETYGDKEEWGKPASEYTKDLLENSYKIVLQNDPNEGIYDIYERGLAWIWVQETSTSEFELLNYKVIQQGLARTAYLWGAGETIVYGDYTYTEWMLRAETESIANKRGYHGNFYDPYWDYDNNAPNSNWKSISFNYTKEEEFYIQ